MSDYIDSFMITIPPNLALGDAIGLVCPSGYMPFEQVQECVTTLEKWGYKVAIGKTVGNQHHYFSGTDAERLADLQAMINLPNVRAVLCGRGGYGLSRIIDSIDFSPLKANPKWIIGFSDITVLHAHLYNVCQFASIHAPMAAAFRNGGAIDAFVTSLRQVLSGEAYKYYAPVHPLNHNGNVTGRLLGGNLSIIAHLIGSASSYQALNGCILFLEDVGEYLYHIDRLFVQMKRAGLFQQLGGLILGGFTAMKDTTIPFGQSVYEIIDHHFQDAPFPICYDFPIGHQTNNYAVKVGLRHHLSVSDARVQLRIAEY